MRSFVFFVVLSYYRGRAAKSRGGAGIICTKMRPTDCAKCGGKEPGNGMIRKSQRVWSYAEGYVVRSSRKPGVFVYS